MPNRSSTPRSTAWRWRVKRSPVAMRCGIATRPIATGAGKRVSSSGVSRLPMPKPITAAVAPDRMPIPNSSARKPALNSVNDNHLAVRGRLPQRPRRRVLLRGPPLARPFGRREFEQHQPLRLPVAFEHFRLSPAYDEASAVLGDAERRHRFVVLVADRVFHIDMRDYVGRHRFSNLRIRIQEMRRLGVLK